jgi:hypothetical protein
MAYQVLEVDPQSLIGDEQLGSKPKVWFSSNDEEWLFKEARAGTGEDWAEKIAAQVAAHAKIDAAVVELATCRGRRGSASRSFVNRETELLFHGNELLAGQITGYDRDKRQRQSDHTLENIIGAIDKLFSDLGDVRLGVLNTLASYMVLDALIGNTDRHHENWGLVLTYEVRENARTLTALSVAPSFDHASSLGRELSDERRSAILASGEMERYVRRGRGGIYLRDTDPHGANPLYLVEVAARAHPDYFRPCLGNLARVPLDELCAVIAEIPADRMSDVARSFTHNMLTLNYHALMKVAA